MAGPRKSKKGSSSKADAEDLEERKVDEADAYELGPDVMHDNVSSATQHAAAPAKPRRMRPIADHRHRHETGGLADSLRAMGQWIQSLGRSRGSAAADNAGPGTEREWAKSGPDGLVILQGRGMERMNQMVVDEPTPDWQEFRDELRKKTTGVSDTEIESQVQAEILAMQAAFIMRTQSSGWKDAKELVRTFIQSSSSSA